MRGEPVTLDGAFAMTMTASSGRPYAVLVAEPSGPAPAAGFPVVFVLDAERVFATMVESIRMRARRPDATGVGPAIVVGVTPMGDGDARARRTYDFTPGPALEGHPAEIGGGPASGGASAFLSFLETELGPRLAATYPVDPAHQVLFGHSLGAYFVLWSLVHGAAFTTYLAASPSIWWNPAALHQPLEHSGMLRPATRVMVTVGEYEQRRAPWQPAGPRTEDAVRRRNVRRMVDHARDFSRALARVLPGEVDFQEFAGEDHASVVLLTIARGLRFALPPAAAIAASSPSQVLS